MKLSQRIYNYFYPPKPPRVAKRHYAAARVSRRNADWTSYTQGANWTIRCDLQALRARARDMAKNSPHFRKFLQMAKSNVVGHKGIQLQCDAVFGTSGRPYTTLNSRIEEAFWEWGRRETCTESGKLSWPQAQQLAVEMLIRDGEVLVEHVLDADNPFGYSLRFWNADWLDETHNEILKSGNRIIMGVELDRKDRPVAYWLTEPPSENFYGYDSQNRRYRRRVDAALMSHIFIVTEDECQIRGVTWFHAAILHGKNLHEYTGNVVEQSRVAAASIGFLKKDMPDEVEFEGVEDEDGNKGPVSIDVAPLSMNELPAGYELQQFDPKQPQQNHAEFKQSMLLDIASALGINGFSLAGDMSKVNFSSARVGLGEEREVWRTLQEFIGDTFCRDVYRHWLMSAYLKGRVEFDAFYVDQLMEPTWRPRGWSYIEPQKDITAALDAISGNLLTYREHFAERGIDLEEWLQSKQKEMELFKQYGIEYTVAPAAKPAPEKPKPDDDEEDEEEQKTKAARGYTNGKYSADFPN